MRHKDDVTCVALPYRLLFVAAEVSTPFPGLRRYLSEFELILLAARLHFRSRRILEFTLFINTAQRRFIDWRHHKEHWWQTRPQRQRALVLNNPFAT